MCSEKLATCSSNSDVMNINQMYENVIILSWLIDENRRTKFLNYFISKTKPFTAFTECLPICIFFTYVPIVNE